MLLLAAHHVDGDALDAGEPEKNMPPLIRPTWVQIINCGLLFSAYAFRGFGGVQFKAMQQKAAKSAYVFRPLKKQKKQPKKQQRCGAFNVIRYDHSKRSS